MAKRSIMVTRDKGRNGEVRCCNIINALRKLSNCINALSSKLVF